MQDLLAFLTTGQYLPAVGAALVIIVGLMRAGLAKKWPWFETQAGGYTLAWGTTTVLYLGTALEQGTSHITLQLVCLALAAGLGASGILDHFRDVKAATVKPATDKAPDSGFIKRGLMTTCAALTLVVIACGAGAREKTIRVTYDATTSAAALLTSYVHDRSAAIAVSAGPDESAALLALAQFETKVAKVTTALDATWAAIAIAVMANDDVSISNLIKAASVFQAALAELGVHK